MKGRVHEDLVYCFFIQEKRGIKIASIVVLVYSLLMSFSINVYSHNSYLDMLFYFGYIPFVFIVYRIIKNIIDYRNKPEFIKILMMKEAYLITALSVSMFTNEYFWLMFII